MPVLRALWAFVKRQTLQVIAGPSCYAVCNNAADVFQSVGKVPALCAADGDFFQAISNIYACTARHTDDSVSTTVVALAAALSYCANLDVAAASDLSSVESQARSSQIQASLECYSYQLVGETPPAQLSCSVTSVESVSLITTVVFATVDPNTTLTTSTDPTAAGSSRLPTASSSGSTSSNAVSAAASSTDTPLATPNSNDGLGKGAIAGIAVGATIGVILLIALVAYFAWRHRRNRMREKEAAVAIETSQVQDQKAQLHSDDYKPHREEMEGSQSPTRVRTIEGVHEMEYQDLSKVRSEMSANEVAAAELEHTSGSSRVDTNSTLIGSSAASEGRR